MGNQQMAFSNHQPPTVEDPNEWYDSVSEIDEQKEQVTAPGNNVVVNGILDELIDSLFESKLANEDLPNQYSPGDEQPDGNNQTSPSTYDEVAPNWKGDASVSAVPERSDSIPPGKFTPSSNNVMFCKDGPVSSEKETQNLTNIRNTLKDSTNESLGRDKLCNDVLSIISQEVAKENVKELFVKSDPVIPLPCPEDYEVPKSATTNDSIKTFELTPRDVETTSQSGKFCEFFCDSKEISSFQAPLETINKSVSDNCDEDVCQDLEQLNTNRIIREGEKILEKTALYLEELTCSRRHNIEKESLVSVTSNNAVDSSELKLNVIPDLKQTIDLDNKPENAQDKHNILEEAHLQEEVNAAPFSNKCYDAGASLEHVSTTNRALDVSHLLSALDPLTNKKFPEEINEFTGIKQSDGDIITRKQQDSVSVPDSAVGSTGRQDELLIDNKDTVPATNSADVAQDGDKSKRNKREENTVGELDMVSDNAEAKSYHSAETREFIINSEGKCNVLQPVLDFDNCANEILDRSSDISSITTTSETLQNAASTPSEPSTDISKDEAIHLEIEKVTEVENSDSVNNIPLTRTSASITLAEDSETNPTTLSKDPESSNPFLQETEIARSFSNEAVDKDEEGRVKLIEANSSVAETTNISPSSSEDTPKNVEPAAQKSSVGGLGVKPSLLRSEDEKSVEVKPCENADNIVPPADEVSLMEENKLPHRIGSPTIDSDISCIGKEENENFQSFKKIEERDRKHIDIDSSVTENIDLPSASISNDMEVPSNITQNKIIMQSSSCNPIKSSLGVTNVDAKPFLPETNSNNISPIAEFSGISTSLVEEEGNSPFCSSEPTASPLINTNMTRKPTEGREKCHSPVKGEEIAKENSTVACPRSETSEDISESTKKTDVSVDAAVLPKTKQSGCVYEEENICDLDEVINQFRLSKHKSESVESYSKLDRRKEFLDKLNTRKPTTDKKRNPEKNAERNERRKDTRVPSVQSKNTEETSSCSKNSEFKLPSISRKEEKEQQISENVVVVQKGDFVNFRGNPIGGEQQQNELQKKSTEVDKTDATNNGNLKKERMPELKPETLKSLIADLSLTKSTTDVGCNTADDWSKRDVSKMEADWLKERKKLVGRITNLHETQNATKFIVKELIFLVTSWMEGKDKDNVDLQEARQKLINERDQALEDLRSVEESFYELHRRYEKTKKLIEDYKKNEEILRRQISEGEERVQQQRQMFDELVKHSEMKIEQANAEILNLGKSRESEIVVLTAQLRKAEMKATSLEKALEQKVRENTELSSICEDLITKCGRK